LELEARLELELTSELRLDDELRLEDELLLESELALEIELRLDSELRLELALEAELLLMTTGGVGVPADPPPPPPQADKPNAVHRTNTWRIDTTSKRRLNIVGIPFVALGFNVIQSDFEK
jgi:hypothetical protein